MKPVFLRIVCLLFSLFLGGTATAQAYYFTHFQVESGLSNNTVMCSMQDEKGFLWFGTKDGLNRFDGYLFKVFRNASGRTGSDFIRCMAEDKKGIIWVGTASGLFAFDPQTESFRLLPNTPTEEIRDIKIDSKGNIWFLAGHYVLRYNDSTQKLRSYKGSEIAMATSIANLSSDDIWISTGAGTLEKYQPATDSFKSFSLFSNTTPASARWIEKIYDSGRGFLFVGTSSQGVKLFDIPSHTSKELITYNANKTEIFVRDFMHASGDTYWIATESGVYVYDHRSGQLLNLQKQYGNPYSLSDNAVYTLCKDKEGGIWAGTYFGGLNYFPRQYTPFEKFFPQPDQNSLSGNAVREIIQDQYGRIWIGTEDAGLNKWDLATGQFTSYKPSGRPGDLSATNIHGLLATGDTLWVGTFEHGLNLMDLRTGKVLKRYTAGPDEHSFKTNFIHDIVRTKSGEILFCTTRGIYRYNRKADNFDLLENEFPSQFFYTTLLEDRSGVLWAGTYRDGLYYYDPRTGKKGNLLQHHRINSIFEDHAGVHWVATESGFYQWSNQKLTRYTTAEGFPSNIIYAVIEDEKHTLWISTSRGLVHFRPQTRQRKVYTKANGLLSDQLNYHSAFRDAAGRLYFGSASGLVRFFPSALTPNRHTPPVYITGFQVNNQELQIGKEGSPLQKSILFTQGIRLPHHQSSFSIDFAALSFASPHTTEYAYKMEGLDKDWTYLKTNRKAYFTELPPGEYTFLVKATNTGGTWNGEGARLSIRILPPWWRSNAAYLAYFLLLATLVFVAIRLYHQRVKAKNRRRLEKLEHQKEKEIYNAKIEFFTNVAHEIRTPLTLIKGPMEKIIKKVDEAPQIKNNLRIMEKNTDRLLELTDQLLDFRKAEASGYSLNFSETDICNLIKDSYTRFLPGAEQKAIRLKAELPQASLRAWVDAEAVKKIISNLLNNALKYAESRATIRLLPVADGDRTFTIEVRSDGRLIPAEMREKIFETFFRLKENQQQSGTGLGLSLSRTLAQLHNGSLALHLPENNQNIFVLTLPLQQEKER